MFSEPRARWTLAAVAGKTKEGFEFLGRHFVFASRSAVRVRAPTFNKGANLTRKGGVVGWYASGEKKVSKSGVVHPLGVDCIPSITALLENERQSFHEANRVGFACLCKVYPGRGRCRIGAFPFVHTWLGHERLILHNGVWIRETLPVGQPLSENPGADPGKAHLLRPARAPAPAENSTLLEGGFVKVQISFGMQDVRASHDGYPTRVFSEINSHSNGRKEF
jgi:hypothetical protein